MAFLAWQGLRCRWFGQATHLKEMATFGQNRGVRRWYSMLRWRTAIGTMSALCWRIWPRRARSIEKTSNLTIANEPADRPDHCAPATAGFQSVNLSGDQPCLTPKQAAASVSQSVTKPWENPSSPCAAIAVTANARAVQGTFPLPASPWRGSASSRAYQSAMLRKRTAVTTSSAFSAGTAAGRDPPRPRRTPRLHPGRPGLVQARCRHLHEKRTALGPRPAQRPEVRHLPPWTILPDRAATDSHRLLQCPARAEKRDAPDIAAGTPASLADRDGWRPGLSAFRHPDGETRHSATRGSTDGRTVASASSTRLKHVSSIEDMCF
jgi:hypothetical protein